MKPQFLQYDITFVLDDEIHLPFNCQKFTPLESPAACSGDEDIIPFRANTGFNAPCQPPRWKVEDFLTGFTLKGDDD